MDTDSGRQQRMGTKSLGVMILMAMRECSYVEFLIPEKSRLMCMFRY